MSERSPASETAPEAAPETTSRRGLVAGLILGLPIIGYGIRGALVDAADTNPAELAVWIVGAGLADDLVVVPLVLGVGFVARRLVPPSAWPAVRAGLIVTGSLCLVAWPFVRGYGRDPTIPSLLNRDYGTGLAVAVAVVWAAVVLWLAGPVALRRVRTLGRSPGRRRPASAPPSAHRSG